MKTGTGFFRKVLLYPFIALSAITLFVSCDKDDDDIVDNREYTVSGNADGSQMVPSASGSGTAAMTGTYDPSDRTLTYTTNWNNMTGGPTSAGFYSGSMGTAGTMVGSNWSMQSGMTASGTYSGTMTLTEEQETQLTSGNMYYSMGTMTNPNGEIRGQMTATR